MKALTAIFILLVTISFAVAQSLTQKIFDTEKAFEKAVAEKGLNAGFAEYMSASGIIFAPEAVNAREFFTKRGPSTTALYWNPIWIDVSSNGVIGYSIGNSLRRPKGKDDPEAFYGHYLSIWIRQPNGEYRAALDTGINHDKPLSMQTEWKSPSDSGKGSNPASLSAADSSTAFYQMVEQQGAEKAYKSFLADDAIVMRQGKEPFVGKTAAMEQIGDEKAKLSFAKRKSFTEAVELAYVHATYSITDKGGKVTEHGSFVQVWKLRGKKWQIVADAFVPAS